jgi:hypothetical protein
LYTHKEAAMSEWLDLELSHHLASVAAPEALWDRISGVGLRPAIDKPDRPGGLSHWAIAAILTLAAAAGTLWLSAQRRQPELNLQQLAIEQLRHPEPLAMHSRDPRAISAWMRQAGIDVTLPSPSSDRVHLLGARVLQKRGARFGAVSYQVGTDTATLLIASSGTAHGPLACKTRGQSYTVACSNPNHPEAACLLCHT